MIPIDLGFAIKTMRNVHCLQIGAFIAYRGANIIYESSIRGKILLVQIWYQGSNQNKAFL
jgi:hypothetical protein